jgi:hypothetical protein
MEVIWAQVFAEEEDGKGKKKKMVSKRTLKVIITDENIEPGDGIRVWHFNGATGRVQLDPPLDNIVVTRARAEEILRAEGYAP